MNLETVEYRSSKARNAFMLMISLVLAATGVWTMLAPHAKTEDRVLGTLGAVGFTLAFLLTLYGLFRPRAVLRLGPERIEAIGLLGKQTVSLPYAALAELHLKRVRRITFLVLVPLDPEYGAEGLSPAARRNRRLGVAIYGSPFVVVPANYSVKAKDLAAEIERRRAAMAPQDVVYPRPSSLLY